jgi:hypothetical protein
MSSEAAAHAFGTLDGSLHRGSRSRAAYGPRSGEIFSGESFMALLRLRNEADRLTSQLTKQSLSDQPPSGA